MQRHMVDFSKIFIVFRSMQKNLPDFPFSWQCIRDASFKRFPPVSFNSFRIRFCWFSMHIFVMGCEEKKKRKKRFQSPEFGVFDKWL